MDGGNALDAIDAFGQQVGDFWGLGASLLQGEDACHSLQIILTRWGISWRSVYLMLALAASLRRAGHSRWQSLRHWRKWRRIAIDRAQVVALFAEDAE